MEEVKSTTQRVGHPVNNEIRDIYRYLPYQLVQDFFHQQ